MRIYLTDLAAYNSGHLIGEWIDLPSTDLEGDIKRVLAKGDAIELEEYGELTYPHEEYFITDYECSYKDIGEYDDIHALNEFAETIEDLDEGMEDRIEAIKAVHGDNYYESMEELVEAVENNIGMVVDGVSSDYELAKKLEYEIGFDDELYQVLGCTAKAYEQLSSYIHTDDIAHTIDTEFSFAYVGNTAYEVYA